VELTGKIDAQTGGKNEILGGAGKDVITINGNISSSSTGTNIINAGAGNNIITINGNISSTGIGTNTISAGAGKDVITINGNITRTGTGTNTIDVGAGDDIISLNGQIAVGALNIIAGEGYDTLILTANNAQQFNNYYKDWLEGIFADTTGSNDVKAHLEAIEVRVSDVSGLTDLSWLNTLGWTGEIKYALMGTASDDTLHAAEGIDIIYGGEGNDTIYGGAGDDIIVGGAGDNILWGDDGHDTFVFNMDSLEGKSKGDTIMDFHVGTDANADILDISDLLTGLSQSSGQDTLEGLLTGGYLSLTVERGEDGKATLLLGVDRDGNAGQHHEMQTLATIHTDVTYSNLGTDPTSSLFKQMVDNDQIKF
jgi:Ca2+-binding RTX toxin-like protein